MLATPSDLASHLQQDLDTATASLALEVATGRIQSELGYRVLQEVGVTSVLDGGDRTLYLPGRPVISVASVTTTDYLGTVETPTLNTDYRVRGNRLIWSGYGSVWPELVTVVYTHGYTAGNVPQVIRGVCLAVAGRVYANPDGIRSETVGSTSVTYNTPLYTSGVYLTEQERADLAAFRIAMVA
jgi:hypothetical protein